MGMHAQVVDVEAVLRVYGQPVYTWQPCCADIRIARWWLRLARGRLGRPLPSGPEAVPTWRLGVVGVAVEARQLENVRTQVGLYVTRRWQAAAWLRVFFRRFSDLPGRVSEGDEHTPGHWSRVLPALLTAWPGGFYWSEGSSGIVLHLPYAGFQSAQEAGRWLARAAERVAAGVPATEALAQTRTRPRSGAAGPRPQKPGGRAPEAVTARWRIAWLKPRCALWDSLAWVARGGAGNPSWAGIPMRLAAEYVGRPWDWLEGTPVAADPDGNRWLIAWSLMPWGRTRWVRLGTVGVDNLLPRWWSHTGSGMPIEAEAHLLRVWPRGGITWLLPGDALLAPYAAPYAVYLGLRLDGVSPEATKEIAKRALAMLAAGQSLPIVRQWIRGVSQQHAESMAALAALAGP